MPKRCSSSDDGRKKRRTSVMLTTPSVDIEDGEILTDLTGKQWKLGRAVGIGGFGAIFLATDQIDKDADDNCKYVAKVETHTSGPLFVEINCYIRIAKEELIQEWMEKHSLKALGMPHYVASGSETIRGTKLRFLILPRFNKNLEDIFECRQQLFDMKTVLVLALHLLDIIEYIHDKGYIHNDIKASNILIRKSDKKSNVKNKNTVKKAKSRKSGDLIRSNFSENSEDLLNDIINYQEQVYLLDFGLASRYRQPNGDHKKFCCDERKAHAGTLLFCSLDAHKGIQARRSDLETLGYNLIYWLTSFLPWINETDDPVLVHQIKQKCLMNLRHFLLNCFNNSYPKFMYDYFKYLVELDYSSEPNYKYCKNLFRSALKNYCYNNQPECKIRTDQFWLKKHGLKRYNQITYKLNRVPLTTKNTNLPLTVKKRRSNKKNVVNLSWSKILTDPENILKRSKRERKHTDVSDTSASILNMDIHELNPTYAMLDVYNKSMEKLESGKSPKYHHDDDDDENRIDGYTPAMMMVHVRKASRERMETEENSFGLRRNPSRKVKRRINYIVMGSRGRNTDDKEFDEPAENFADDGPSKGGTGGMVTRSKSRRNIL